MCVTSRLIPCEKKSSTAVDVILKGCCRVGERERRSGRDRRQNLLLCDHKLPVHICDTLSVVDKIPTKVYQSQENEEDYMIRCTMINNNSSGKVSQPPPTSVGVM